MKSKHKRRNPLPRITRSSVIGETHVTKLRHITHERHTYLPDEREADETCREEHGGGPAAARD